MDTISDIFSKMRATEMNDWVGGSDPEAVGDATAFIINRMMPINNGSKVLDFGCGIGRTIVSLIKNETSPEKIVGIDIMPQVIDFCKENISSNFAHVTFDLTRASNDHYDRFIKDPKNLLAVKVEKKYRNYFDNAYAFSVFTHISREDFVKNLKSVCNMLTYGGYFLFTCFALTEFSRSQIEQGQAIFPFTDSAFIDNGEVFLGHKNDPLAFIAFDKTLLEKMVWDAGLSLFKIEYGDWMGGNLGSSLHDLIVVRKPYPAKSSEEIELVPVVDRSNWS